jgi:RNA polymerase sigma factor (sigma-70 family)
VTNGGPTNEDTRRAVAQAFRDEWTRVLASTVRVARDLDLAEECAQEAFAEALISWSRDGVPRSPGAWLTAIAARRVIDSMRRNSTYRRKVHLLIEPEPEASADLTLTMTSDAEWSETDDTMRLVFMCCHPSLSEDAQMALTLRLVCGMATKDVARCFLVSETTMAARLTRAKQKIAVARIPFRVPTTTDMTARLDAVLAVVYLLFTIGHTAPTGATLVRDDVVGEAKRLARLLLGLMPSEREIGGLLALMLVNDARRDSRVDAHGSARRISEQDRSTWDHHAIDEAHELLVTSLQAGRPGRYTLQAAIATLHAEAPTYDDVDWPQIVLLYDQLLLAWPTPVVQLNRAVALSKTLGPAAALEVVVELEADGRLRQYQYLPAVKAYLLEQLGRVADAQEARRRAFDLAANDVERDFLLNHPH